MSDKLLEPTQVISGVAILLSFFAGYKYGLRNTPPQDEGKVEKKNSDAPRVSSTNLSLQWMFRKLFTESYASDVFRSR